MIMLWNYRHFLQKLIGEKYLTNFNAFKFGNLVNTIDVDFFKKVVHICLKYNSSIYFNFSTLPNLILHFYILIFFCSVLREINIHSTLPKLFSAYILDTSS